MKNILIYKAYREQKMKEGFVMFKFMLKCKMKVTKCGGLDTRLNNFPRHNLTFVANSMMSTGRYEEKAKRAVYMIINNVFLRQELNKGIRKTYKDVRFM